MEMGAVKANLATLFKVTISAGRPVNILTNCILSPDYGKVHIRFIISMRKKTGGCRLLDLRC